MRAALRIVCNALRPRSTLTGRELQLHLDAALLYAQLPARLRTADVGDPSPEQVHVARLRNEAPLPPLVEQAPRLRAHMLRGAVQGLAALSGALKGRKKVREQLGFEPVVGNSGVKGAGRGVFVEGRAKKGSVVGLYPGVAYQPSEVRCMDMREEDADYFIQRFDGVVIDGAASVEMEVEAIGEGVAEEGMVHPLALGHLVNHPGKGGAANCLQFMLDLDVVKLPPEVRGLVPCRNFGKVGGLMERAENVSFRQRVPSCSLFASSLVDAMRMRRTVALVATRDIENEEVFINYRFNPNAPSVPEWYHDCDPEASERRWQARSAFAIG